MLTLTEAVFKVQETITLITFVNKTSVIQDTTGTELPLVAQSAHVQMEKRERMEVILMPTVIEDVLMVQ